MENNSFKYYDMYDHLSVGAFMNDVIYKRHLFLVNVIRRC